MIALLTLLWFRIIHEYSSSTWVTSVESQHCLWRKNMQTQRSDPRYRLGLIQSLDSILHRLHIKIIQHVSMLAWFVSDWAAAKWETRQQETYLCQWQDRGSGVVSMCVLTSLLKRNICWLSAASTPPLLQHSCRPLLTMTCPIQGQRWNCARQAAYWWDIFQKLQERKSWYFR